MGRGTSYMCVTGPNVVKAVTHEDGTMEGLGGADTHSATSGVAHFACDSEPECLQHIRDLFRFVPSSNLSDPPRGPGTDPRDRREESLLDVVPDNANKPYDMHEVIKRVVDDAEFREVPDHWATNRVPGFARRGGHATGVFRPERSWLSGVPASAAPNEASRSGRHCNAWTAPPRG